MKNFLLKNFAFLYRFIPVRVFRSLTSKNNIHPFYHAVSDVPPPHLEALGYYRTKRDFIQDIHFFQSEFQGQASHDSDPNFGFRISFDDGLSENMEWLLDVLVENKVNTTFFINPRFIDNHAMFYRHKISLVMHELKKSSHLKNRLGEYLNLPGEDLETYLNNIHTEEEIDAIAAHLHIDIQQYLSEKTPYLTSLQLSEIQKRGFHIGNHSFSHPNFQKISLEIQKQQIIQADTFLQALSVGKVKEFAFPFGSDEVEEDFFNFLFYEMGYQHSYGISGLKADGVPQHKHRIPMEIDHLPAEDIIRTEYLSYWVLKCLGKSVRKRPFNTTSSSTNA